MLMNLLICFVSFSQKAIVNQGDTSICFSVEQSRDILKELNRCVYLDSLTSLQRSEIDQLKLQGQNYKEIIGQKDFMLNLKDTIISYNKIILDRQKSLNKEYLKEIRKQRIEKIVVIIAGSFTTGIMTYLFIKK